MLTVGGEFAFAFSPAPPRLYVRTDDAGSCYARVDPTNVSKRTRVFRVAPGSDELLFEFEWHSNEIYLKCFRDGRGEDHVSVVRLGRWAEGSDYVEMAIAFYLDGKLMRAYSRRDIGERPEDVQGVDPRLTIPRSAIKSIRGYGQYGSTQFDVLTADGRILSFDAATGALINP